MVSTEASESFQVKLGVQDVAISYGQQQILQGLNFAVKQNEIFGIIGPANAGKTSFLKAVNRMDMFDPNMKVNGLITFNGLDISQVRNV